MRLFAFLVLTVGGVLLLWNCAEPFWMAAAAIVALLLAGWLLGIGLWPPLGRFELALASPERAVQLRALEGLETLLETDYERPIQQIRAMLEQAETDEDAEVRRTAARLLARLDASGLRPEHPYEPIGPQIVEAGAEEDEDRPVARILREDATPSQVVQKLVDVLAAGDPEDCRQAVDALEEIGAIALPALRKAREHATDDVRVDLSRAIRLIEGRSPLGT